MDKVKTESIEKESPEVIPHSKPQSKFLLPLFAVLLLGMGLVGGYYISQNTSRNLVYPPSQIPQPTQAVNANVKTYQNITFNYSLKIPDDWEAFRQTGDDTVISIRPTNSKEIPITVNAQSNTKNLTVDEWINNQFGGSYPRQKKIINNIEWIIVSNTISPYPSLNHYTSSNTTIYELNVSTLKKEYTSVFDAILDSFQFEN